MAVVNEERSIDMVGADICIATGAETGADIVVVLLLVSGEAAGVMPVGAGDVVVDVVCVTSAFARIVTGPDFSFAAAEDEATTVLGESALGLSVETLLSDDAGPLSEAPPV